MPSKPPPEEHVAHRGLREGATSLIKEREIVKICPPLWCLRHQTVDFASRLGAISTVSGGALWPRGPLGDIAIAHCRLRACCDRINRPSLDGYASNHVFGPAVPIGSSGPDHRATLVMGYPRASWRTLGSGV